MAVLKDLIVHGSSRFLNKIYASQIQAESGIFNKLIAKDATMENATVVGLLDVQGQLHTNAWTNSNIATIDGSFYITPTISSAEGTASNISATTIQFVPRNNTFAVVSSLYYYDTSAHEGTWLKYSRVLVTGQVQLNGEWIPLGTILGYLNADGTATSLVIAGAEDNKHRASPVLAQLVANGVTTSTSLNYRNLKVSLYQRSNSSSNNADAYKYPLGIFMTAMGTNGKTFLDIYGGGNVLTTTYGGYADPNVRIGNLSGLPTVGNQTPVGWGIYTTNGYFKGTVAADNGYIGGASISNGVLTVPAANVSGELTAATINGSKITANTITASQIATNAITADELAANAVTSAKIKAGEVKATNIASNAVTADKLDATTINASNKLTVGAMTTDTQTSIENKNIYDNKFYRYKKDITVYGDSNKYYPVYFNNTSSIYTQNDTHRISLYRGYSQKAPNDWNTSTHKGGLTLNIKWNYGGWGGATYNCEITEFTELYSTMVGDVQVAVGSGMTSAIFLRGGGETGALYHIYCDVPIETARYNGTFPAIGNNENTGTDYMYTGSYHWKYATPLTTPNTIHIKSLIAKNTAANYITDIDSNKGITIKPADISGNDYLQINSSAINFYRNDVETLKIEDSAIRVGKLGNNLRNVYITDSAVQIRNNTSVLAEYGSSIKLYNPTTTTVAVEISSTGATFTGNITATGGSIASGVTIGGKNQSQYLNSNIQIGGRNLFRYSYPSNTYWWNTNTSGATVSGDKITIAQSGEFYQRYSSLYYPDGQSIPIGTELTLSCYFYENTIADGNRNIYYASQVIRNGARTVAWLVQKVPANYTGLWSVTFTTTEEISGLYIEYDTRNMTSGKWVCGPCKLEIGNKATAWSPAPEDLDVHKYVTDIDSNKGITIKPVNTSGNDYLELNSSAISMYKGGTKIFNVDNNGYVIVGKAAANKRNVYITDSAVQIRNNTAVLAEYGDSIKLYQPTTTTTAVEISSTGASFNGNVKATSLSTGTKTASATGKGTYIDKDGNIYVGNGSTNNFTVTDTGTITATDAHITGEIVATSGRIGGIDIENGTLKYSSIPMSSLGGAENYAETNYVDNSIGSLENSFQAQANTLTEGIGTVASDLSNYQISNNQAIGDLINADNTLNEAIESLNLTITNGLNIVNDDLGNVKSWITFDTEPQPRMRLGKSDSPVYAYMTNDRLEFRYANNDNPVAYIAGDNGIGKLYATNSVIVQDMQFGNWAWYQRSNGHMSVKWVGEE